MAMTKDVYLPWATGNVEPEYAVEPGMATLFVTVTAVIHGKDTRSISVSVPTHMTAADFKGHLAVQGAVPTCFGLEVKLEEGSPAIEDSGALEFSEGQVVHLQQAPEMVSIMALAAAPGSVGSADDEVYELVLPAELTGAAMKVQIEQATAGALQPLAIFLADGEEEPRCVGDEETVKLRDEQIIIVQPTPQASEAPAPAPAAGEKSLGGLLSSVRNRLFGGSSEAKGSAATKFCLRCASNIKVKGASLSCTSASPWAGCAVFDVPDPAYFEITVQLAGDAPSPDADGLAGRWMLGVVPAAAAAVKSEKQRRQLMGLGHFVTVCHGHPAKVHAPSMPRGSCGEDVAPLPGELRKGQKLTLRWAAAESGGALMAQVDDGDPVTLPYAPAPFDDVRPCLVFGGKPSEVLVSQLDQA